MLPTSETQWLRAHVNSGKKSTHYIHDILTVCNSGPEELTLCNSWYIKRSGRQLLQAGVKERLPFWSRLLAFCLSQQWRSRLFQLLRLTENIHSSARWGPQRVEEQTSYRRSDDALPCTCFRAPASNTIWVGTTTVSLISSHRGTNDWHYDPLGCSLGDQGGSCQRDASSCQLSLTNTDTRPLFIIKRQAGLPLFINMGFSTIFYNVSIIKFRK